MKLIVLTGGPGGGKIKPISKLVLNPACRDHPNYYRLDNEGQDWAAKSQAAHEIIADLVFTV